VAEITAGAKLYLDSVNAKGGINGQSIEIVSLDDGFDPPRAAANAKTLIADPRIVALFLNRGTPHTQAIMPLLSENHIALIGPSTGAMVLHTPVHPWVFNVRATYQRETEHLMRHLSLPGARTVAIVQVDDSFGNDSAEGALKVVRDQKQQPGLHIKYDRAKPDIPGMVAKVMGANPNPLSVLYIGTGSAVVDGVKALRNAGYRGQIATLSPNASSGFIKALGPDATHVVISQVFPSPRTLKTGMAAEAARLASEKKLADVTPQMMEGFAAAKVLVAALKAAAKDKDLTRAGVKKALDGFNRLDLGGLEISYSPTDHTGLDYSDLAQVSADGTLRR
jgi:ABC-type branched-subunit amino acid transport system substrate-binding protein